MQHKDKTVLRVPLFLQYVRGHECSVMNVECLGKIEAAHVRTGTDGGMAMKPSDKHAIPLCHGHHAEQHRIGEPAFEKKYGIGMLIIAAALWAKWLTKTQAGQKYRANLEREDT